MLATLVLNVGQRVGALGGGGDSTPQAVAASIAQQAEQLDEVCEVLCASLGAVGGLLLLLTHSKHS